MLLTLAGATAGRLSVKPGMAIGAPVFCVGGGGAGNGGHHCVGHQSDGRIGFGSVHHDLRGAEAIASVNQGDRRTEPGQE